MSKKRILTAFLIAVVVSGCFTIWLGRHIRTTYSNAAFVKYIAAARAVDPGETLSQNDVQQISWPAAEKLDGAIEAPSAAIGKTTVYPLAKGQPILQKYISSSSGNAGLSPRIPDGMRALSLKSDKVVGVAGYLLPGTHVDVLGTLRPTSAGAEPVTSIVLQDVPIVTAGQKTEPDPSGKPTSVDVVTVLVTPEQAERVVLASTQGTLHFVLRNGMDHGTVSDAPMRVSQLTGQDVPVVQKAVNVAHVTPKKKEPAKAGYSVEVMRGEKQTVERF